MPDQNLNWEKVARHFTHPVALRILEALAASAEPLSPKKLSEQFEQPLGNVSYHVKVLREAGLIELVGQEPRRGAVENYYALKVGE